jgi:HD-GYP domain-containing protein (c-di-GMP phosphodiesterase class II)
MRYVTTERLSPGMTVAKPFFGRLGGAMLQKGFVLTKRSIDRIVENQYSGLYIEDDISKGIEIDEMVSGDLRSNVTKAVRRLITNVEMNREICFNSDMRRLSKLLNSLVDEIMASDVAVVSVMDVKEFDLYTYQHSVNVCVLSCVIGLVYNIPREDMYNLALAAILHDVGKILIDKAILNKPGKLTAEEFEKVKKHPIDGYNILKRRGVFPGAVLAAILQHHEKYDGSGYIEGKRGRDIQLFAQIISVVDVYDAITSKRPYHEPILPSEAYEYIMGNAGRAFSMEIVDAFTKKGAPFPLGVQVQLSNGEIGIVCKNHSDYLMRPLIRLHPRPGSTGSRYLDLKNDSSAYNVTIQKVFA